MDENGVYCLFLRKVVKSDFYAIVGIYQGKFDLNLKEFKKHPKTNQGMKAALLDPRVEFMGSDLEHFQKLKDEVVAKYEK
ncbi:hypothetical protein EV586_101593 [Tumebacillus sp. BK434]|nr:hypothetical protein EV586_101593 [Tumebacillus sp. BK434]